MKKPVYLLACFYFQLPYKYLRIECTEITTLHVYLLFRDLLNIESKFNLHFGAFQSFFEQASPVRTTINAKTVWSVLPTTSETYNLLFCLWWLLQFVCTCKVSQLIKLFGSYKTRFEDKLCFRMLTRTVRHGALYTRWDFASVPNLWFHTKFDFMDKPLYKCNVKFNQYVRKTSLKYWK